MRCKTLEQRQSKKHGFRSKVKSLFTKMVSFTTVIAMFISLLSVDGFALVAEARETSDGKLIWSTSAGDFPIGQCTAWTVPVTGKYTIDMRAGDGGSGPGTKRPTGAGATYVVNLTKGNTYYIAVGGNGTVDRDLFINDKMTGGSAPGGWNGGGASTTRAGSGGGATAIYTSKIDDGQLKNYSSSADRNKVVAVVGGGGGAYYAMEWYDCVPVGNESWYDCHDYTGPTGKWVYTAPSNYKFYSYATHYHVGFESNPRLTDFVEKGGLPTTDMYKTLNGHGQNGITNGAVSEIGHSRYLNGKAVTGYKTRGSESNGRFGQGQDAPTEANVGYAGAGGGGLYGGLAVNTNSYPAAVGGGGSGKVWASATESSGSCSLTSTGVSIEYMGRKQKLQINLHGVATYNGGSPTGFVIVEGYENDTIDLNSSIRAIEGHTLSRFSLETSVGSLNNGIFTFGNGPSVVNVICQSPGSIEVQQINDHVIYMFYRNSSLTTDFSFDSYLKKDNGDYRLLRSGTKSFNEYAGTRYEFTSEDGSATLGNTSNPLGLYRIYVFGAGGNGTYTNGSGGKGGYVSAQYNITKSTTFDIQLGHSPNENEGGTGYSNGGKSGNRAHGVSGIKPYSGDDRASGVTYNYNFNTPSSPGKLPTGGYGSTAVLSNSTVLLVAGGGGGVSNTTKAHIDGWVRTKAADYMNVRSPFNTQGFSVSKRSSGSNGANGRVNSYYTTNKVANVDHNSETDPQDIAFGASGGGGGGFEGGKTYTGDKGNADHSAFVKPAPAHIDAKKPSDGGNYKAFPVDGARLGGTLVHAYNGTNYVNASTDLIHKRNGNVVYSDEKDNNSNSATGIVRIEYLGLDTDALWYGIFDNLYDTKAPLVPDANLSVSKDTITVNVNSTDLGTDYCCKLVATSINEETFEYAYTNTRGVSYFQYYVDDKPNGETSKLNRTVAATKSGVSGSTSLSWKTTDFTSDQWLHIIAVDGANNKSEIKNIRITELYKLSYELNGGVFGSSHPNYAGYNQDIEISNPTRTGFKFLGWNITNMDEPDGAGGGEHYWGSANGSYEVTSTASSATFNETRQYTHFKNLRNRRLADVGVGTVYLEAVWIDEQSPFVSVGYTHIRDNNDIMTAVLTIRTRTDIREIFTLRIGQNTTTRRLITSGFQMTSSDLAKLQAVDISQILGM